MVEVVVRIDDKTNRLAGAEFFRLCQHEHGSAVIQRAFNHHQVIFHFNCHAVVRAARHVPYAIGHFGGNHVFSKGGHKCRHFNASGNIGFNVIDRQVQHRVATHALLDAHRKLDATCVLVVRKTDG